MRSCAHIFLLNVSPLHLPRTSAGVKRNCWRKEIFGEGKSQAVNEIKDVGELPSPETASKSMLILDYSTWEHLDMALDVGCS